MSSEHNTVTIIGSEDSRTMLKDFAGLFANGISVWEDRLPIPDDDAYVWRAGLRWSLGKQGLKKSNSTKLDAMWKAMDDSTTLKGKENTVVLKYSAEAGVSWALLTGKKKDEHLKATFGNAIQALVDEGLDVTENTPRTVLFFSPIGETDTADMKTWMKHDFHNFGLPPNKEKIDETIA